MKFGHRNCTILSVSAPQWCREQTHGCGCSAWKLDEDGQWRVWRDGQWRKPNNELYDANYAEWQKRQDLLAAIQAQVKAWRQENEKVSAMLRDCIFSQSQQLGIVAHMHERSKCANALEDIWQAHRGKEGER